MLYHSLGTNNTLKPGEVSGPTR
ncbi:Protein of unknown function [Bacillus toyonensis]|nr:Protein of unknown function [Bacillus toyonensis]